MNTPKLFTIAAVSAGLAFGVAAQAKEKEHEEQTISSQHVAVVLLVFIGGIFLFSLPGKITQR